MSRADFEALWLRLRQEKSVPLLKKFGEWLDERAKAVLPKSPLAAAVGYARNQWAALQVYATAGFLEIDNNAAERALRPVAVGRKNYLFFGSDVGGETVAVLYSSCRRAGGWGSSRGVTCVTCWVVCRAFRRSDWRSCCPDEWARRHRGAAEASRGGFQRGSAAPSG